MTETILKETKDYKLVVGPTAHHLDTPDMLMYKVMHKEHGVTELETSVLPRALQMVDSIQRDLDQSYANPDNTEGDDWPPIGEIAFDQPH